MTRELRITNRYRDQVIMLEESASQAISAAHAQAIRQIQPELDHLYRALPCSGQQDNDKQRLLCLLFLYQDHRLERLKRSIVSEIGQFSNLAKSTVAQAQLAASALGNQFGTAMMQGLSIDLVRQRGHMSEYVPDMLNHLFDTFGPDAATGVGNAIARGLTMGTRLQQIGVEVAQQLDVSRQRGLTTAATDTFRAYNRAAHALYRDNARLVRGWIWHCQFVNSCAACVALHGSLHSVDEELIDHCNGNCVPIPYIGNKPDVTTGQHWLGDQDEATQRKVFGTDIAYQAYVAGNVKLSDFIGIHDHPMYGRSVYQRSIREIING